MSKPSVICPKCSYEQRSLNQECPKCGIVFEKYRKAPESDSRAAGPPSRETLAPPGKGRFVLRLLTDVDTDISPFYFGGRVLLFLGMLIWGVKLAFCPVTDFCAGNRFLHLINLPFHEFGHLIFKPLGPFLTSLGGSIGQLLMPLVCLFTLLFVRRDTFGASACLWWLGENFLDLAPYINDAKTLALPLLGGNTGQTSPYGFHDWEFILTEMRLLHYDRTLAGIAHKTGILLLLAALLWAGYVIYKQFRNLNAENIRRLRRSH